MEFRATHRRLRTVLAGLSLLSCAPTSAAAGESTPAVPDATIRELQAQIIAPDAETSDATKLRRYRLILRNGARVEDEYADASNLYLVQNIMLAAARAVMRIEGSQQGRRDVVEVAVRILASDAPPEGKLQADILMLQAKLARLDDRGDPDAIKQEIEAFVDRYRQTRVEPGALMVGVQQAQTYAVPHLAGSYLRGLERFRDQPGVGDFLRARTGKSGFVKEPFCARVTRLDGSTLTLPRDLLGRVVLVHFWNTEVSSLLREMDWIAGTYPQYKPFGLEVVSVNVDRSRRRLDEYLVENSVPGIVTFSPLGPDQPVVSQHRIPRIPCSWLIGRDGRVLEDAKPGGGYGLDVAEKTMPQTVLGTIYLGDRLRYYRSGEFLARWPGLLPEDVSRDGGVPGDRLDEIHAALLVPPPQGIEAIVKADRFREVLKRGADVERQHPDAPELIAVRNWMMIAAKGLALAQYDESMDAEAVAIAGRILPEASARNAAGPPAYVLADYLVTQATLRDEPADQAHLSTRIEEYVARYAETDASAPALILGAMLAMEYGRSGLLDRFVDKLGREPLTGPGVRGFLRTVVEERPDHGLPFAARLKRLDGDVLELPKDLAGKVVVVHFWSVDHVPKPATPWGMRPDRPHDDGLSPNAEKGLAVVGINLDRDRARVEAFLAEHDLDWIHTSSGRGFDDPTARQWDIRWLPSSWLIDRKGRVIQRSRQGPIQPGELLGKWIREALEDQ